MLRAVTDLWALLANTQRRSQILEKLGMLQGPGVKEPTHDIGSQQREQTFTCRDSLEPCIDKALVPHDNRKIILRAQIHSHRAVIKDEFGTERQ